LKGGNKLVLTAERSYKIVDIILSKQNSFTLEDITRELQEAGFDVEQPFVEKALILLRDKGFIIEYGSRYSIIRSYF